MNERIEASLNYIKDNLDKPLDLDQLAEQACLSPTYFHRQFKKHTGSTPQTFVVERKMEAAQDFLLNSNQQIQDIALQLGYADYETFSRAYKRHFTYCAEDTRNIGIGASENGKYRVVSIDAANEEDIIKSIMGHPEFQAKVVGGEVQDIGIAISTKAEGPDSRKRGKNKFTIEPSPELTDKLKSFLTST